MVLVIVLSICGRGSVNSFQRRGEECHTLIFSKKSTFFRYRNALRPISKMHITHVSWKVMEGYGRHLRGRLRTFIGGLLDAVSVTWLVPCVLCVMCVKWHYLITWCHDWLLHAFDLWFASGGMSCNMVRLSLQDSSHCQYRDHRGVQLEKLVVLNA